MVGVTRLEEHRFVLIGNTGSGKSASGNTILGRTQFLSKLSASSVTQKCEYGSTELAEDHDQRRLRRVKVVDMPGFGDTRLSMEEIHTEIAKCLSLSAPGPHAFLLVVPIGRYTIHEDQAVIKLAKIFGEDAVKYHTVVLFTGGDKLDMGIEDYLKDSPAGLTNLIDKCGGRYHVFNNNKNNRNVAQVKELIEKVDRMVKQGETGFFTNTLFQEAEAVIREEQKRMMMKQRQEKEVATSCVTEAECTKQRKLESEADKIEREDEEDKREIEREDEEDKEIEREDEEDKREIERADEEDKREIERADEEDKREIEREDEESQHSGSSEDSRSMWEKAALSPRVLRWLKILLAGGITGLAVGVAFGVAVPLTAACSAFVVGKVVGLAAVNLAGISAAGAVGVGNAVGAIVAATSGTTAVAVGAATGAVLGGLMGVSAGLEADSPKEAALNAFEEVSNVGLVAVGAAVVVGAALGSGAAVSAAVGAQGATSASVAHAPTSVGALPAETATTCSPTPGAAIVQDAVQAAPNAAATHPIRDAVITIGNAVATGLSVGSIAVKVVRRKTKDSEKNSVKVTWNK
ncbi:uncharacterized protein LOC133414761 [Phycodurus eques]|uniref:uncharacterized protein LOC133414761 n=1 Tax=Phycodurus eques TaxID=693459 RepID=UPI002ACE25BF|nr:uncharacterized protein LOC133414761 [Phycodurus eques]